MGLRRWPPLCGASVEGMDSQQTQADPGWIWGLGVWHWKHGRGKADQNKPYQLSAWCSSATHYSHSVYPHWKGICASRLSCHLPCTVGLLTQLLRWISTLIRLKTNPHPTEIVLSPQSSLTQLVSEPFGELVQEGKEHRTAAPCFHRLCGLNQLQNHAASLVRSVTCSSKSSWEQTGGAEQIKRRYWQPQEVRGQGLCKKSQVLDLVICEILPVF